MVCQTDSVTIKDIEYTATQWPAEKSLTIKFELIKAFGGACVKLKDLVSDFQPEIVSEALGEVFKNYNPEDLVGLIKKCVVGTMRDGQKITESTFTQFFSGDELMTLYSVFVFVLRVNYGNFFQGQLAKNILDMTQLTKK